MADRCSNDRSSIVFEPLESADGLEIIDSIERRRRQLRTDGPVSLSPVDPASFELPVKAGVELETEWLTIPEGLPLVVRNDDREMIGQIKQNEVREFPAGRYTLDPGGILKAYVKVESALDVHSTANGVTVSFDGPTRIQVGSRASKERPEATVTTTGDPADVLAAISTFGSGLKTLSPERSFPIHRGHPPAIEVGEELSIPGGLDPLADEISIEVPPTLRHAYVVAPLAYYLGASVEPGETPRLVGPGLDREIGATASFQADVERLLKRVVFLDCLTRTEGLFQIDLYEREAVEPRLYLDFAALYDAPHHERVRAYVDVPHELVQDAIPTWSQTAHVEPSLESLQSLPYLVDDLTIVREPEAETVAPDAIETGAVSGIVRGAATMDGSFVHPTEAPGTIEQAWVGEGTPLGATKAVHEAYENRVGRSPSTGGIDIAVVCNADVMAEEGDVVDDVYGSREDLPFDVEIHRDTDRETLAEILQQDHDFLHYVGHIGDDGFRCADGRLDIAEVDDVAVDAFFLNACQSYDQGMEFVRSGAIGGIVTVRDVVNFGAIRIGKAVARLLNCGFPLRSALEVARDESVIGALYGVIGDGTLSIVQPDGGTPVLISVDRRGDSYSIQYDLFGTKSGLSGIYYPFNEDDDRYYLASGTTESYDVGEDELRELLSLADVPVLLDGDLTWSSDVDLRTN